MDKEALKLALEHIEGNYTVSAEDAITAIKEALAQPEPPPECQTEAEKTAFAFGWFKAMEAQRKQEPVAWGVFDHNLHDMFFTKEEAQEMVRLKGDGSVVKPLCITPPQRTWAWLTYEEQEEIVANSHSIRDCVTKTTAKLKEKNT